MKIKYNKVYTHKRLDGRSFLIYIIGKEKQDKVIYKTYVFSQSMDVWQYQPHSDISFIKEAIFPHKREAIKAIFRTIWRDG